MVSQEALLTLALHHDSLTPEELGVTGNGRSSLHGRGNRQRDMILVVSNQNLFNN